MDTYTFVLDYKGGTYISQIKADDVKQALIIWASTLEISEFFEFSTEQKDELIDEVHHEDEQPALLDGLFNAWCYSKTIADAFCLVNIILTKPLA